MHCHFVLNQQETHRSAGDNGWATDAHVSEKTLWEHYYVPFQAAVDAGVAAVMCSYNYVNGHQACANKQTLSEDLKAGMGFDGFIMSDWWALEGPAGAANGTDMEQPGNKNYFGEETVNALPEGRLDDMASRVLRGMAGAAVWGTKNLAKEQCRVGCDCDTLLYETDATSPDHTALAREIAAGAAILLKNDKMVDKTTNTSHPVLPLRSGQKIAVLGTACDQRIGVFEKIKALSDWTVGSYYTVGGSGRVLASDTVSVYQGLQQVDGLTLIPSLSIDLDEAAGAVEQADIVLICAGATASESYDRKTLNLDQEEYINALLDQSWFTKPIVVLALAPGAFVPGWRNRIDALVTMILSGEQTGNAAADILSGVTNPSGKLPMTLPALAGDAIQPCQSNPCVYEEGRKGGWHVYDGKDGTVLDVAYEFGRGLSYTTFEYGVISDWTESSGTRSLTFSVKNVGEVAGKEVAQLYIGFPVDEVLPPCTDTSSDDCKGMPEIVLRGYKKTPLLLPGKASEITFQLTSRDLSVWDSGSRSWRQANGKFDTFVSTSSREKRLCGGFQSTDRLDIEQMRPCGG